MDGESADQNWVMVPVPPDRVLDVMRFLAGPPAEAAGTSAGSGDTSGHQTQAETNPDSWDQDSLRQLVASAPMKQVRLLELLASRAPNEVTAGELREHLVESADLNAARSGRALGAVMKAIGLRSKYYGGRNPPFRDVKPWTPELGNRYVMPKSNAEPILEAVSQRLNDDR